MAKRYESTFTEEEKEYFMREAMKEAHIAGSLEEVPIGAVLVLNGEIIGRGHNLRETTQDATTHAEMTAIRKANEVLTSWRLEDTALFVTVEPCAMCSGACLLARIPEIYFGATNPKGGTAGTVLNLFDIPAFNHAPYVEGGVLEEECAAIMTGFFKERRVRKKNSGNLSKNEV
ncbi:MAG: tRNA adenosine(34) deaminase TadA [Lactobacillales bacterium]|nr:tRNA adenosine(34) deaminase TadA [Lactobacillales bacterium]